MILDQEALMELKHRFNPNWSCFPVADDAVTVPKLALPIVRAGLAALGRKNAGYSWVERFHPDWQSYALPDGEMRKTE